MPSSTADSSSTRVVAALTEMILTGELPAGSPIRQVDLAHHLGVSRTPVREAVGQLIERGLLEKGEGRMTRVHQPSLEDLLEIYELRILTEKYLAEKAAEQMDDAGVAHLAELERALHTASGDAWHAAHREFHDAINKAAAQPRFISLALTLKDQAEPYVRLATKLDVALQEQSAHEHAAMVRAMSDHDVEAAGQLATSHLRSTVDSVDQIFRLSQSLMPLRPLVRNASSRRMR